MTDGPTRGHNARIFLDDAGLYAATECSVDFEVGMLELAHKDINPGTTGLTSKIRIPDVIDASFSTSGILYSSGNSKAIFDKMIAGTKCKVEFTTDEAGDHVVTFDGFINKGSFNGSEGDNASVSFSGVSTGNIQSATVA